jgi:hypothetical protein
VKAKLFLKTGLLALVLAVSSGGGLVLAKCDTAADIAEHPDRCVSVPANPVSGGSGGGSNSGSGSSSSGSGSSGSSSGSSKSSTSSSNSGRSSTNSNRANENENETEHGTEAENENEHATEKAELHKRGAAEVALLRKEHQQTPEQRQKKCESRKQGISTKFTSISRNSLRLQSRFDSVLSKAITYQQTNNVQVTGFSDLVAKANAAKSQSSSSITALQLVTPSIDCNSVSVAEDVATFKAAAAQTRDDLNAYKKSVKAVLHSLEQAAEPKSNDDGSNHQ